MSSFIDMTSLKFGRLSIIERADDEISNSGKRITRWTCLCDCGNYIAVRSSSLRKGKTKSCGCYARDKASSDNFIDLTGRRFGKLSVIERDEDYVYPNGKKKLVRWKCICDCGKEKSILRLSLTSGTQSCGCYNKKRTHDTRFKDLTGMKYGMLTVINFCKIERKMTFWNCVCDCGTECIIRSSSITRGKTVSCGCLSDSLIAKESKKYFIDNYEAISEYKIFRNPHTGYYLPYDIYLPKENIFVEINGKQHYLRNIHWDTDNEFSYRKKKDRMKKKFAKQNGFYIEVDLRKVKTTEEAIFFIENKIKELL